MNERYVFSENCTLDLSNFSVIYNGRLCNLTTKQHDFLELFIRNPNIVLTFNQIVDAVWDTESPYNEKQGISDLLNRLNDYKEIRNCFDSVRGIGYRFTPPIQPLIQNKAPDREPKESIPAFIPDLSVPTAPVPEEKKVGMPDSDVTTDFEDAEVHFTDIKVDLFLDLLIRTELSDILDYCNNYIIPDLFPICSSKSQQTVDRLKQCLSDFSRLFTHLREVNGYSYNYITICMEEYFSEKGNRRYKVSLGQLDPEAEPLDLDEIGYETEWELNGYAIDPKVTENPDISDEAICAEVLTELLKAINSNGGLDEYCCLPVQ